MQKPITQLDFQIIGMAENRDPLNRAYIRISEEVRRIIGEEFGDSSQRMVFFRSNQYSLDEDFEAEDWGRIAQQSFAPRKVVSRAGVRKVFSEAEMRARAKRGS